MMKIALWHQNMSTHRYGADGLEGISGIYILSKSGMSCMIRGKTFEKRLTSVALLSRDPYAVMSSRQNLERVYLNVETIK